MEKQTKIIKMYENVIDSIIDLQDEGLNSNELQKALNHCNIQILIHSAKQLK